MAKVEKIKIKVSSNMPSDGALKKFSQVLFKIHQTKKVQINYQEMK